MTISRIYRTLLYLAFLLLAGVSPAYDKRRRKKIDKEQTNKEAVNPHEHVTFEEPSQPAAMSSQAARP